MKRWFLVAVLLFLPACGQSFQSATGRSVSSMPTKNATIAEVCGSDYAPGRVPLRRLTRIEYANTVRDLLYINTNATQNFGFENLGLNGFTNDADGLQISDTLLLKYHEIAEQIASLILASKTQINGSYARLASCALNQPNDTCVNQTINTLGKRAFRRPLRDDEFNRLKGIFSSAGGSFDQGLGDLIIALLINPKFILLSITDDLALDPAANFALDSYEIASRLSYFLWQSMPDDQLLQLADSDQLKDAKVLQAQVERMLKDSKVTSLILTLRNELAGLQAFASSGVSGLNDSLHLAMVAETDAFLRDLVTNNRQPTDLIGGNYSFVNKALADHYGLSFPASTPTQNMVRISNTTRVGLGMQGSVLTATSGGLDVTHPTTRGKWAAGKLLCAEPPPPPPNIPPLPSGTGGSTPREMLAVHTQNPACKGCHQLMDPIGFALEIYDPFGKQRSTYANNAQIDPSGSLTNGLTFSNPQEMYSKISQSPQGKACITQHFMGLALARAAKSTADACVQRAIAGQMDGLSFSQFIAQLVTSNQFLYQKGEAQ